MRTTANSTTSSSPRPWPNAHAAPEPAADSAPGSASGAPSGRAGRKGGTGRTTDPLTRRTSDSLIRRTRPCRAAVVAATVAAAAQPAHTHAAARSMRACASREAIQHARQAAPAPRRGPCPQAVAPAHACGPPARRARTQSCGRRPKLYFLICERYLKCIFLYYI